MVNCNFAKELKNLRKKFNLTQIEVAELSFMSRRKYIDIEKGKINPSIEDIISLTKVYKKDLMDSFLKYRKYYNHNIENLIDVIEFKLSDMDYDSLDNDIDKLKSFINLNDYIKQYYYAVMGFYHMKSSHLDIDKALINLREAIEINNSSFEIKRYEDFLYSDLELRVLIAIADCLRYRGNFNYYFKVCEFCYKNLSNVNTSFFVISLHYATIKSMNENYTESIEISNKCIDISSKTQKYTYLPFFYYMNYLNYKKMNQLEKSKLYLKKSIFLCDCYNKPNLKKLILEITNT